MTEVLNETEEVTTPTEEVTTPTEEVTTPTEEEFISEEIIDELLNGIIKKEEISFEPVFDKKENKEEIDLEEIDEVMEDLENQVKEKDTTIQTLSKEVEEVKNQLEGKDTEITSIKTDLEKLEAGLGKISEHPILGPLAIKLIQGEELDIPEYLKKMTESEIEQLPQMDEVNNTSVQEKVKTAKDNVLQSMQQAYY